MNTYVLESLENGSHGIIPNEGINYFVGKKRITLYKDGKKVLDKEVDINPDGSISKYNLLCDGDKDPVPEPVNDIEEYNVANMLPQTLPEGAVIKKEKLSERLPKNVNVNNIIESCNTIIDSISNNSNKEVKEQSTKSDHFLNGDLNKLKNLVIEKVILMQEFNAEDSKLRQNDIKRDLIKNQQEFRKFNNTLTPSNKEKASSIFNKVKFNNANKMDASNIHQYMSNMNI
jgi:hypothetical protein